MGLMLVIFSPFFDLTNSLLMKIPVGCLYLWPLGAVSSMERSDMFEKALMDSCNRDGGGFKRRYVLLQRGVKHFGRQ